MEHLFQKLNDIFKEYDNFIIMGHKDPDLDSLGSSLALSKILKSMGKESYILLDDKHLEIYNNNIKQVFEKLNNKIECVNKRTYKKIEGKTLLIIIDVNIENRVECEDVLGKFDTIVLDHHIKSKNYIKDTKFMYIDSNLSSMSELIAYYSNYLNINLHSIVATILLSGIEIDTNSFNLKTTSKTYEAASMLMDMGADSILKQELLKETKDEYVKRANYIKASFMINSNMAMCVINKSCTSLELAELAEELLTFEEVEASFTVGKLDDKTIGVSSRSLGDINVERIMKKLGGGGHKSNAAAQIVDKSIKEVKQLIIDIVNE